MAPHIDKMSGEDQAGRGAEAGVLLHCACEIYRLQLVEDRYVSTHMLRWRGTGRTVRWRGTSRPESGISGWAQVWARAVGPRCRGSKAAGAEGYALDEQRPRGVDAPRD